MKTSLSFWKSATVIGMVAVLVGVSSGCVATRRFTRSRVDEKAQELSARIDANQQSTENNTKIISKKYRFIITRLTLPSPTQKMDRGCVPCVQTVRELLYQ